MRASTINFFALGLLLGANVARAGDATPAEPLKPLAFLGGYCWNGTFADGKKTDEHCYEWVFGGKFLRDRHVVRGGKAPYQGETLYFWDSEARKIAYIYFNSDGGVSRGTLTAKGDQLFFPAERYSEGGKTREFSTTISRDGERGYASITHELKDGTRMEAWRTSFKRGAPVSSDG
jgi:hypothetical protein